MMLTRYLRILYVLFFALLLVACEKPLLDEENEKTEEVDRSSKMTGNLLLCVSKMERTAFRSLVEESKICTHLCFAG